MLRKWYLPLLLELDTKWEVRLFAYDWRLDIDLTEAQETTEACRQEYNTERPPRGLEQHPPAEYAALFTPQEDERSPMILRS